ncbi:MAG: TonB-dependent receptor [Balneolales bacterium]
MKKNYILFTSAFIFILTGLLNNANSQDANIVSGIVTDSDDNNPLPGVNIVVSGTGIGVATNTEGYYEIEVPSLDEILLFTYVGYENQEIAIDGRTEINVSMVQSALTGEDIVVVGYGVQRRRDLTGTVSQVESRELTKVTVGNTTELLAGRVPGLMTKHTTGLPGAISDEDENPLQIRGFGAPLILVDGIEMPLDFIDPNDIESISVLKDASAAIYGSRAGNGVILVTTKRGERGRPMINFKTSMSGQQPTIMPNHVNAAQWAEMWREGELNAGVATTVSQEEVDLYRQGAPGYESYDWYGAVFKPWAPMQDYSMNVSGGSNELRYFLSAGYLDQNSAYRSGEYSFNRYNVRTNIDAYITPDLTASINLSARAEVRKQPTGTNLFNSLRRTQPIYSPHLPDGRAAYSGFGAESPVAESSRDFVGFNDSNREFIEGALSLNYQLPMVEGLEAEARLAYSYNTLNLKNFRKTFEVYEYDPILDEYTFRALGGNDDITLENERNHWLNPRMSVRYERGSEAHRFNAMVLAEWIDEESRYFDAFRRNLLSPEVPFLFAGSVDGIDNFDEMSQGGRASYVSRLQYGYRDRYRIEGTIRADATHRFPENSRWGFFPSIATSWTLSEEPFFNVNAVDELQLRLSYSQSGSDDVAAFRYLAGYFIRENNYIIDDQVYSMISEQVMANPDITWLDMTIYNIGLNASFWNRLLSTELNVFQRDTDNIFGTSQENFPSTFGAELPQLNINATRDRGFEVLLGHDNRVGELRYSVSANMGYARERYVRWSEPEYTDEDEIRIFQNEGNYTNREIGYRSDGLFMTQSEIDAHSVDQDGNSNSTLRPGDIRYIDLNDDGVIDFRDQTDIGRGQFPDMTFGMNFNFAYKGFDLTALFQGASFFNINMTDQARGIFPNDNTPHTYQYEYRWQPDPNNPNVNINPDVQLPAIEQPGIGTNENNDRTSDFWLQDGTYVRLKNLNLTYNLPTRLTSSLGIVAASVYVSGSNLFMFNKLGIYSSSFDPEIPTTGQGAYPTVRVVSLGINLNI